MNVQIERRLRSAFSGPRPDDWLTAAAFVLVAEFEIWVEPIFENGLPGPRPLLAVLGVSALLPLAWRRSAPLAALSVMLVSLLLFGVVGEPEQSGFEFALAVMLGTYSVAAQSSGRRALVGGALVLAGGSVYEWLTWTEGDTVVDVLVPHLLFLAAWVAGREVAHHREQANAAASRAQLLEEAKARDARMTVAEERRRIARELHDIVGHGISVMGVQAAAVRRSLPPSQKEHREALMTIERVGSEAMAEMNTLLSVLRAEDEQTALEPMPGLAKLDDLVDETRRAGIDVTLHVEGQRRRLPASLELTGYRILQEALTNVRRHANGAPVAVTVRYGADALELLIADAGAGPALPSNGGHGLAGMRERAAVHGGHVTAGPAEAGGFVVKAHLPVRA